MSTGEIQLVARFGALVRAYRREAGLTQQELATKAGLSVAALRDFEQGRRLRPRERSLTALASALGLSLDQAAGLARAVLPKSRRESSPWASGLRQPTWSAEPGRGLWLTVLGPLKAWRNGRPLYIGPPARRAVLGLLVMDPGMLTRRDTIIDVLWGDAPPSTAVGLVQAHVSRLRRVLEPPDRPAGGDGTGRGIITSVGAAYQLCLVDGELDLLVFRYLAERAAAAHTVGDDMIACEIYEQAMGLWRSDPLDDIDLLSGHPGITLLRQQLADVLLRYADVACGLGQHRRVLPRLQAFAAAEPLNESSHARLMIALAGSGHQAAAIGVYEDLRLRLDRELGLYPGEELAEAHLRVLRQDIREGESGRAYADRPMSVGPPGPAVAAPVVPRQLPAPPRYFVGRASELDGLTGMLDRDPADAGGVVIAALTGMAGIGKTALAIHWAHQAADRFPDGQLFVDLHGFSASGMPLTSAEAVRGFLTTLGVLSAQIPADAHGQAGLYRSLLAGRRMLIVLDNARDPEQVRPLLPGSPGCVVLVTSRNRLTGLAAADGAQLRTLGVLTEGESRELLARYLGVRTVAEPAAVNGLIALCGCLPLALCDAAARAAVRPSLSLEALASEMREKRGRLDVLETGESATSVRMVFSWSHLRLSGPAARMFALLGMHAGPDISVPAAGSLAGVPVSQAHQALAELCDEHLVTEAAPGRYQCHDLLRAYAAETAHPHGGDVEPQVAVRRLLDHYLHTADTASAVLYPPYAGLALGQPWPGVRPEPIATPAQAAEWFGRERHVLLAFIRRAADESYAPHAWELPWATGPYFRGEVCWRTLVGAQETALAVAVRLGDVAGQALARHHLGLLRLWLGEFAAAGRELEEAIELAGRAGDLGLSARAGLARARALQAEDRALEALVQVGQALRLFQAEQDRDGVIRALNALGWHLARQGDRQQAAEYRGRARALRGKLSLETY